MDFLGLEGMEQKRSGGEIVCGRHVINPHKLTVGLSSEQSAPKSRSRRSCGTSQESDISLRCGNDQLRDIKDSLQTKKRNQGIYSRSGLGGVFRDGLVDLTFTLQLNHFSELVHSEFLLFVPLWVFLFVFFPIMLASTKC